MSQFKRMVKAALPGKRQSAGLSRQKIGPSALRSPLFWRIAAVVFLSIVCIEAILLLFSWFSERDRLLARIDDSLALLSPILAVSEDFSELDRLVHSDHDGGRGVLLGYVLETAQGSEIRGGDHSGLHRIIGERPTRIFDRQSGIYESALSLTLNNPLTEATLWYRIDASHVVQELNGYVIRIVGLVVLISVFVTVGCLLCLTPLLIRPLQRLARLMQIGQSRGLKWVAEGMAVSSRRDEIGHVYRSFDRLTQALIAAEECNGQMTERFQQFADLGADSFWELDERLHVSYAAGDLCGMFGIEPEQAMGQSWKALSGSISHVMPDIEVVLQALKQEGFWEGELKTPSPESGSGSGQSECNSQLASAGADAIDAERQPHREYTVGHRSAGVRTVRIIARALHDERGRFRGIRGTAVDVSVASELAAELKYQATHDPLTGLYNRREFDRLLSEAMEERRQGGPAVCVCMLDLDRFKIVNDSCGHGAGDILLKQIALLIRQSVREQDVVSRHGGDEFTVMLRGCGVDDGARIADKIRKKIGAYRLEWESRSYSVGVSIGICEVVDAMPDEESVLSAADACCIMAKNKGRNQVKVYRPDDELVARQQGDMQWMPRICQALEEGRLQLYQQLIVPLNRQGEQEIHLVVLLRLIGRDGVIHSPAEFLPAAERYNLIGRIDRWVVAEVIAWLERQSPDSDQKVCININLSGMSVSDDTFRSYLRELLDKSSVNAGHLCFELTESAAMGSASQAIEFFRELRALGCRVALDDFGTGFSSLSQIKHLPIDYIKIDGTFIQGVVESRLDRALVKCVADFARILKVRTVAEFVDSSEVCDVLRQLHIDHAQGYLFSHPEPLKSLRELIDESGGRSDADESAA